MVDREEKTSFPFFFRAACPACAPSRRMTLQQKYRFQPIVTRMCTMYDNALQPRLDPKGACQIRGDATSRCQIPLLAAKYPTLCNVGSDRRTFRFDNAATHKTAQHCRIVLGSGSLHSRICSSFPKTLNLPHLEGGCAYCGGVCKK